MYALADVSTKKKDGTIASTSRKCVLDQFNDPRKRKLTPKKSSELMFKKFTFGSEDSLPKKKVVKEPFTNSISEENFRQKISLCNPSAGWLLNFIESENDLGEEQVPQFLEIEFNVDMKSETVKTNVKKRNEWTETQRGRM